MTSSPPSGSDREPGGSTAFHLLEQSIQRWVWNEGWATLHDVQERAIQEILKKQGDLIICAATAGGKTEAAFLPILSQALQARECRPFAICISPLKALINDQHRRLEALCEALDLSVCRWHGDVSSHHKQRFVKTPDNVLLITPESMEAMFVLRGSEIGRIFAGTRYVLVDEMHSFIGTERGRQLQSLLHRIELLLRRQVRRIGLSATLGDTEAAAEFLRPSNPTRVTVIESGSLRQEVHLQVRGYLRPRKADLSVPSPKVPDAEDDAEDMLSIARHLFAKLRGSHNLVFANSRNRVELLADMLRRLCADARLPNEFWPHHGSISKDLRADVEEKLKTRSVPTTVVCTSTLEMGIDIGSMESIAQIDPAPSVTSLRQRLGRSGRRGNPAALRVYAQEEELSDDSAPHDRLRLRLVHAIAQIELLQRHWFEPPEPSQLHLSTLVQQMLSLIAQHGGVVAQQAYEALCRSGPFAGVSPKMFTGLLRGLGEAEILMQSSDGTLLLAPRGERIVNRYDFYPAFVTPDEFRLVTAGKSLGAIPINYPVCEGMTMIFAGRHWRVLSVDLERKVIDLAPSRGGHAPRWSGRTGLVHDVVRQEMLALLTQGRAPCYLNAAALHLLSEAQTELERMGLDRVRHLILGSTIYLFPWLGDRSVNTLILELLALGVDAVGLAGVITVSKTSAKELDIILKRLAASGPLDAVELAATVRNTVEEKYDHLLPDWLQHLDYASRALDTAGAHRAAQRLIEHPLV